MGAGIAQWAAAGTPCCFDAQPEAIARARPTSQDLQGQVRRGAGRDAAQATLARIRPADWDDLAVCQLVIEAIAEDMEASARCSSAAAGGGLRLHHRHNTSSLSITAIARALDRAGGRMHFFNRGR